MSKLLFGLIAVAVAAIGWKVGGMLSSDAISLIVGLVLGLICALPVVLIAMYAHERRVMVQIHVHEPKQLQQPANTATALITQQPAERWRVLANSTSLAVRESEVITL